MFDLIIKNGRVVDGSGNPWFKADVGIRNGKIAKVGVLDVEESISVLDAKGLIVSPGFIDMHSHSDLSLLINPLAESKIRQGITTEVVGNCGASAAPLNPFMKEEIKRTTPMLEEAKLELDWSTFSEYLNRLNKKGIAVNVASLVGHGNIRAYVMDYFNRSPTKAELEQMKRVLAQALEEGAFGLSTGLIYPPSCYASTEELIELCRIVAQFGGFYTSHIRGEGEQLVNSVKEAIEIGERGDVPVEISHHKAGGKANWGKVVQTLKLIDEARDRNVDITCDVYPYLAGSFGLDSMLPPHAQEGGVEKLLERLRSLETRQRLKQEMEEGILGWSSPLKDAGWDTTMIAYCNRHPEFEGKAISEIAQQKSMDPFDFVFDLLIEESASVSVVRFLMCEEDVRTVLKHPVSMIGTDASAHAPYGVLSKGKPHPRSYGTFPRVLGTYVREEVLTMENAIRKMTSLPAQRLKLRDRGLIREGMWADITIIDLEKVRDTATYTEPHRYPEGIEYVLMNGKIVIDQREHTGTLAGQVLRLSK